jgi:sodium pump decarboxylase gamma subunit
MVTLLGFMIVICLLLVLILVLILFGKLMSEKKPESSDKWDAPAPVAPSPFSKQQSEDEGTVAAIAMALAQAQGEDKAAIAMALHLYYNGGVHDIQTTRLTMQGKATAWNAKSFGMNNIGF